MSAEGSGSLVQLPRHILIACLPQILARGHYLLALFNLPLLLRRILQRDVARACELFEQYRIWCGRDE